MTQKFFTHTVRIPPLTDVRELISQYHSLFSTMGIPVADAFPPSTLGFSHPIPEENEKLKNEFFGTMSMLQGTLMQFKTLAVKNTRVQNTTVTFVFECNE